MDVDVVKSGITCATVQFRRSQGGLSVTVKVTPEIEALMKSWGSGESSPVTDYGRQWVQQKGGAPLRVWSLGRDPGQLHAGSCYYRISKPGEALILDEGQSGLLGGLVNMSFLRLVGVSEGNGVTFELRGVHTLESLRALAEKVKVCIRRLYTDFLMPIDISVSLTSSTQETKL
jgi:hypothetical protein